MDYDHDGDLDLLSGSYDPGNIFLFRGNGNGKYAAGEEIVDQSGLALVHHPVEYAEYEKRKNDANADQEELLRLRVASFGSWVAPVDWEHDGDLDLLIGSFDGHLYRRMNEGTREMPVYGTTAISVEADGVALKVAMHANPVVADWNADGRWDLIVSSGDGSVGWYENMGSPTDPRFGTRQPLVPAASDTKFLEQNLRPDDPPVPGVRAQICVTDYNEDGRLDLIVGDYSDINVLRDLTATETAEQQQVTKDIEALVNELQSLKEAMSDKKLSSETREAKEAEFQRLAEGYQKLDESRKSFFASSGSASFIWLYLRQPAEGTGELNASANATVDERHANATNDGRTRDEQPVDQQASNQPPNGARTSEPKKEPHVTLQAKLQPIEGKANRYRLTVEFVIERGWHIKQLNPETPGFTLKLPEGMQAVGQTQRPLALPWRIDPQIPVYEGTVAFHQELEMSPATEVANGAMEVEVHYQVCNEVFCLPLNHVTMQIGAHELADSNEDAKAGE